MKLHNLYCHNADLGATRTIDIGEEDVCCYYDNIIITSTCDDQVFKEKGFKCVDKEECYDKLFNANIGVEINDEFVKAVNADCSSTNQVCCRVTQDPEISITSIGKCEDQKGRV